MQWEDLDKDTRIALTRWFNSDPTTVDKRRLTKLVADGRFWKWPCLLCNEPCVHADPTEKEWPHFQGLLQMCQNDQRWRFSV